MDGRYVPSNSYLSLVHPILWLFLQPLHYVLSVETARGENCQEVDRQQRSFAVSARPNRRHVREGLVILGYWLLVQAFVQQAEACTDMKHAVYRYCCKVQY